MRRVFGYSCVAAALLTALLATPALALSPTVLVVDEGAVECPDATFTSIQAAIDVSSPNGRVIVCNGTYSENLVINTPGLILSSMVHAGATIQAAAPGAVVLIEDAEGVKVRDFVISGPFDAMGSCATEMYGVRVIAGSATVKFNRVTEIWADDPTLRGCQEGLAVVAEGGAHLRFIENVVEHFQKNGVTTYDAGTYALVEENTIAGEGPIASIAQNGVQISYGSTALVTENRISDMSYTGPDYGGTGVLTFQPGAGLQIIDNRIVRSDDNVALYATQGALVAYNVIRASTKYDGIYLAPRFVDPTDGYGKSKNNFIRDNIVRLNMVYDCEDGTTGSRTAGTANTWRRNVGDTASPPAICRSAAAAGFQPDAVNARILRAQVMRPAR